MIAFAEEDFHLEWTKERGAAQHQSRLLGVDRQAILREPFRKYRQSATGVLFTGSLSSGRVVATERS
jgi:hypothetical protein